MYRDRDGRATPVFGKAPSLTTMLATQLGAAGVRFVLYMACIVLAIAAGYAARRMGLLKPTWARPVMSAAIIGCDAPIACLAIWHLVVSAGVWKVPVAGAAVGVAVCLVGLAIARRQQMTPPDAAVFGLQGGMGNVGYTLGGSLCFALWGIQGLALEQMYCLMWPFFAFLFCFPIARHYGQRAVRTEARSTVYTLGHALGYAAGVLTRSLTDLRSLPLYTATLGLALNLWQVGPPPAVRRWHIIDVLMVVGIIMQFGGVGMTVRARRLPVFWKKALGSTALKLVASPILMVAVALALGMTGLPLHVCILLAAMPTALYSVLMANLFGLNRDLANATFILTHAICLAAIVMVFLVWNASGLENPFAEAG